MKDESKKVAVDPVSPVKAAEEALVEWENDFQELDDMLREAQAGVSAARRQLELKEKHLEGVASRVVRARNASSSEVRRRIIEEQPYDGALKAKVQKLPGIAGLVKAGATDQQIKDLLQKWPSYESNYSRGPHAESGRFWIGDRYSLAGDAEVNLAGAELVAAVRRVMQIPQPVKKPAPVDAAAKKPTAAKPAAKSKASAKPQAKQASSKPTTLVADRKQTYGQWLSTLRGNWPKQFGVDLGNDHDNKLPDLVKLFNAKVRPSDAKQILIAAGWIDSAVELEDDVELLHFASQSRLRDEVKSIESPGVQLSVGEDRAVKRFKKRIEQLAPFSSRGMTLGIEYRGQADTDEENRESATAAPATPSVKPAARKPRQSWLQFVSVLIALKGGPSRGACDSDPFWKQAHADGLAPIEAIEQHQAKTAGAKNASLTITDAAAIAPLLDVVTVAVAEKVRTPKVEAVTVDGHPHVIVAEQLDNLGDPKSVLVQKLYDYKTFNAAFRGKGFALREAEEALKLIDKADPDFTGLSVFVRGKEMVVGPRSTRRTVPVTPVTPDNPASAAAA